MTDTYQENLLQIDTDKNPAEEDLEPRRYDDIESYLAATSIGHLSIDDIEQNPNLSYFHEYLNSLISLKAQPIKGKIKTNKKIVPAKNTQPLSHLWWMTNDCLARIPDSDSRLLFNMLHQGRSFVVPRPLYIGKNKKICGFNYDSPLVINATVYDDRLYFHIFDAEDAYAHRNDILPEYPTLHWYDYVLDFFAKFFGCRREVCKEWDRFRTTALSRGEEKLEKVSHSLSMAKDGDLFFDENPYYYRIPYSKEEPMEYALNWAFHNSEPNKIHQPIQESPFSPDVIPEEPPLNAPESQELIDWFKNRYENTQLEMHREEYNRTYPQLFSKKTLAQQKKHNIRLHNEAVHRIHAHLLKKPISSDSEHRISSAAAYHAAIVYGLAESINIKKDIPAEKYDQNLLSFLCGDTKAMPTRFQEAYQNNSGRQLLQENRDLAERGRHELFKAVLRQKDLLSPWSIQLAEMGICMKKYIGFINSGKYEKRPNQENLDYTTASDEELLEYSLQKLYEWVHQAEQSTLTATPSKSAIKTVIQGQTGFAFLRRLGQEKPENRLDFLRENFSAMERLQKELTAYANKNLHTYEDPVQALLQGHLLRDYQSRKRSYNIIADDDLSFSGEEILYNVIDENTRTDTTGKNKKTAPKKARVAFKSDESFTEITNIKSFKNETKEMNSKPWG
ncbi:MAG: hypothetical protein Q4B50_00245 [Bacillota bacterium]|nr:hypothetical protein [Bacillota bacterium]